MLQHLKGYQRSIMLIKTGRLNKGIPSRYKSGAPKPLFGPTSQLSGNFNSLYLWNETGYRQSDKCLQITRGLLHCLKTT